MISSCWCSAPATHCNAAASGSTHMPAKTGLANSIANSQRPTAACQALQPKSPTKIASHHTSIQLGIIKLTPSPTHRCSAGAPTAENPKHGCLGAPQHVSSTVHDCIQCLKTPQQCMNRSFRACTHHITLHFYITCSTQQKRKAGTPFRSQREAHRGRE
jgi:hypothetical protein